MLLIKTKSELEKVIDKKKLTGKKIGFVPTMGALHKGHLSLMRYCRQNNDVAIASIFVNPTQFNDKNDLKNYPRTLDNDLAILEDEGCDIVFVPEVEEMYPAQDKRVFDFGKLDKVMEGAHRPGHFNGVAQIVSKLFDAVKPDNAYFGQKDFQQLAIIKQLVKNLGLTINIVPCPIVREADGLAMSSRNQLLGKNERQAAPIISQTLTKAVEMKDKMDVNEIKIWVTKKIDESKFLKTEYFELVNDVDLQPIINWNDAANIFGCIAVKAGNVRLIDNIRF
jgi:pantoate--beta-alanine ligase